MTSLSIGQRLRGPNMGAPGYRPGRASWRLLAEFFEHLRHLRDGVLRADLVEDARELPGRVDDERGTDDAHVLAAIVDLLAPDAVLLGDGVLGVREQREPEAVLVVELRLL